MKAIIIYLSSHHGNTKKVVESMAKALGWETVNITKTDNIDIAGYDLIGFASGIYFSSFHEKIKDYISSTEFASNQKIFLVSTCGIPIGDYGKEVKNLLAKKGVSCVGCFQCRGYDTYGFFGKIGGIAKKHPNHKDLAKAQKFAKAMAQK